MNLSIPRLCAVAVVAALSTGCASIVGGTSQVVSVEALDADRKVSGAQCSLKNPKGEYFVTTPGTVTINRAYDDLLVKCELAGYDAGTTSAKSTTKAMAFGNIIFGGVVGGAVDIASGAAYEYPSMITVKMRSLAAGEKPAEQPAASPGPSAAVPADQARR
ncbi:hypothetical protein [Quisquiliibacterium transsilvanicum]|uniref:Translation initiation factor 2 n=1 Tax=Quisquiliibacterium transsilvanicum TaxID=1549638 RepID=A0A7W8M852_9BURK|nr:hypothetical protein [Quisquiliibacterium transsilvanicum]